MAQRWGINYLFKDGEIIKARDNETQANGAIARYYRRAENGMPTLDGNGEIFVDVITENKADLKSAIYAIEGINEKEIEIIATGLESLLDRNKAEIKDFYWDVLNGLYLPNETCTLDENGKKINDGKEWVAKYEIDNNKIILQINPALDPSYDFGFVSSCINGLNELKSIEAKQLKTVASELKKYI